MKKEELVDINGGFWEVVIPLFIAVCGGSYTVAYNVRKAHNDEKYYDELLDGLTASPTPTPTPRPTPTVGSVSGPTPGLMPVPCPEPVSPY